MKLSIWPEEDQEDVPAPLISYNSDQKISNTSSDNETADVNNDDV